MKPLFEAIVKHVPPPAVDPEGAAADAGRRASTTTTTSAASASAASPRRRASATCRVAIVQRDGSERNAQLMELYGFEGLKRTSVDEAGAGDIVVVHRHGGSDIGDTICDREPADGLPPLQVDEPTMTMIFQVNKSPFAGKEGKYVTSRNIRERLEQELQHNVALRVEETDDAGQVQGLGPRRAAPVGPDREHAPRGLRAGGIASGR